MEWYQVVKAASIFMGIQLLILVVLLIRQRSYWLTALAYIMVAWFFRQFFWGAEWLYTIKVIFISGYQELFIPPVIFVLILSLVKEVSLKRKLLYLSPSLLLFFAYLIWRLLFLQSFMEAKNEFFLAYMAFLVGLNALFLIASIGVLRKGRHRLISKAYFKYGMLVFIFIPQQILAAIFSVLGTAPRYEIDFLIKLSESFDLEPFQFVLYMMSFVQGIFMVVMILSELTLFKNLQLPKKLHKDDPEVYPDRNIRAELEENGAFRNPNLSVEEAAKSLGLSRKTLSIYLQSIPVTFNDLINSIRIEDFKKMIGEEENQKYDLVSIAKMAGFSSKATFNRVFKEKEGITPSEYKKQIEVIE